MKKPCVVMERRHFVFGTEGSALRYAQRYQLKGARFHWHRRWHFWTRRG